jgi:hypothetical protein
MLFKACYNSAVEIQLIKNPKQTTSKLIKISFNFTGGEIAWNINFGLISISLLEILIRCSILPQNHARVSIPRNKRRTCKLRSVVFLGIKILHIEFDVISILFGLSFNFDALKLCNRSDLHQVPKHVCLLFV